jgi:V-type H+-transporting ATPase subunit H
VIRTLGSDVEVLRVLVNLLKNAQDPVVLAVAAHDLAQYVKHYDRGKKYVDCFDLLTRFDETDFVIEWLQI